MSPGRMEARDEALARHFSDRSQWYVEMYSGTSATPAAHFFSTRVRRVRELLSQTPAGKALDVGCGPGTMFRYLLDRGFECFGVDLSPQMVDACQRQFGHESGTHFEVGTIEGLPFPDACFDVVLCLGVLEYVDAHAALREVARTLKPGGTLVVSMLNGHSPYRLWDRRVYRPAIKLARAARGHPQPVVPDLHPCSERTLRDWLTGQGLEIVDVVYFDFNLFLHPLDDRHPRITVTVARALEALARSPLRRLGTGFLVKAIKSRCGEPDTVSHL